MTPGNEEAIELVLVAVGVVFRVYGACYIATPADMELQWVLLTTMAAAVSALLGNLGGV